MLQRVLQAAVKLEELARARCTAMMSPARPAVSARSNQTCASSAVTPRAIPAPAGHRHGALRVERLGVPRSGADCWRNQCALQAQPLRLPGRVRDRCRPPRACRRSTDRRAGAAAGLPPLRRCARPPATRSWRAIAHGVGHVRPALVELRPELDTARAGSASATFTRARMSWYSRESSTRRGNSSAWERASDTRDSVTGWVSRNSGGRREKRDAADMRSNMEDMAQGSRPARASVSMPMRSASRSRRRL